MHVACRLPLQGHRASLDPAAIQPAAGALWTKARGASARLLNLSENHTYLLDGPWGRFVLRVHRAGYQSRETIASELAWLAALEGVLPVPRPVAGEDGQLLQRLGGRDAVLFRCEAGAEPAEDAPLAGLFTVLGRYAARLHAQVGQWTPPPGFSRPAWTQEAILDADGIWGDWRCAPGVAGDVRSALDALDGRLRVALANYGREADRFGLIHADMRLANLLVDGERVVLIDFDDCGFGWFVYDLAAALSFIEMRPDLDALIDAWLEGYEAVRPLANVHREMIAPMILLRRMALVAWIGSHSETPLALRHAPTFARDTVALARRIWPER